MPFDNTPPETTTDVFSLIDWLEHQPRETEYDFAEFRNCLLTRFIRAQGDAREASYPGLGDKNYWEPTFDLYAIARTAPYTYAAALDRAHRLLEEHG